MSSQIYALIATTNVATPKDVEEDTNSRTELDSHANMPLVGLNASMFADTGRVAEVSPYTPEYKSLQIPIVDSAVLYDCPYSGKAYVLVIRNALHVPAMQNNLLPPFMLREADITVNDAPKIQVDDPSEENH